MTFDGRKGETFLVLMASDVASARVTNAMPGVVYVFVVKQGPAGGYNLTWGQGISNGIAVDSRANAVTVQSFITDTGGRLKANLPGTWSTTQ